MSGGGTTTSTSGPPPQVMAAYQNVMNQAQQVAQTPYSNYPGQIVAGFSPDEAAAIGETENAQGIANPYINAAAQYTNAATTPLSYQQFSPAAIAQYQSPYTQNVVNATQAQFANQNAQQQASVQGNAAASGAWGGDRSAVAQGITAGQQALAEAPTIAGLENAGYTTAEQELNTQQQMGLGAQEAQGWLNSQAGYGMANLGQEALNTSLTGASALEQMGGLEQSQAQQYLNVPYEQYQAAAAYPFETTGWLANLAEGIGGASGGNSSSTAPGASPASQIAGAGIAAAGAFGAYENAQAAASAAGAGGGLESMATSGWATGGRLPARAVGGGITRPTMLATLPGVPDVAIGFLPGGMAPPALDPATAGMGIASKGASSGKMMSNPAANLMNTSSTSSSAPDNTLGEVAQIAQIAAAVASFARNGGPIPAYPRAHRPGGITAGRRPHRASGGSTASTAPTLPTVGGITMSPGRYAGSPMVPLLPTTTGIAAPGGSTANALPQSVSDYLAQTQTGTSSAKPPSVPISAPPAAATSLANFPTSDPFLPNGQPNPNYVAPAMTDPNIGGDAGHAYGGIIHRDAGGDLPVSPEPADEGGTSTIPPPPTADSAMQPALQPTSQPAGSGISRALNSPWMALVDAGLGIMGGRSPNAGVNIGQGALEGINLYNRQRQSEATLGLRQQQIQGQQQARKATQEFQQADLAERGRHNAADEETAAKGLMARIDEANRRLGIEAQNSQDTHEYQQARLAQPHLMPGYGPDANGKQVAGTWAIPANDPSKATFTPMATVQTARTDQGAARVQQGQQRLDQGATNETDLNARARSTFIANYITRNTVKDPVTGNIKSQPTMNQAIAAWNQAQPSAGALSGNTGIGARPGMPTAPTDQGGGGSDMAPAAPPGSAANPLPAPPTPQAAQPGMVYQTPKGPLLWTGSHFMPMGPPQPTQPLRTPQDHWR